MQEIGHPPVQIAPRSFPELMPDGPQAPRWFALYTASRHEKRVAQHLSQREIEFYLPLYKSEREMERWIAGDAGPAALPRLPLHPYSTQ